MVGRTLDFFVLLALLMAGVGCGDDDRAPSFDAAGMDAPGDTDAGGPVRTGIKGDAVLVFTPVYESTDAVDRRSGDARPWTPMDLDTGHDGALWVIQRMDRKPGFTDAAECTTRGSMTATTSDDDCFGLQGGTVTITDPGAAEPATEANGRARLVVDWNSLHFMRRPAGIAFGLRETTLEPTDPGAQERDGTPLITTAQTYFNIFATCHEHETGNLTDNPPFIGPSLWTGDPAIYDGTRPSAGANGAHIDMLHATQHCVGIAWERDNLYWTLNGVFGTLDRYDFGNPHLPGHFYHDDGVVERWFLEEGNDLVRVQDVPSGMEIADGTLYLSDTGNGRILAIDISATPPDFGTFRTFEGIGGTTHDMAPQSRELVDSAALGAMWGGSAQPSGLAVLDEEALVILDNTSGNLSIVDRETGEGIRTVDTGFGPGAGGVTVMDGTVYFAHMGDRRVYRIDVME